MKKKYLLIIYLFPFIMTAQTLDWQWVTRGGGNSFVGATEVSREEQVYDIETDSQQNIYMLSHVGRNISIGDTVKDYYDNYNNFNFDVVLASYNCEGEYRWSKVIGGRGREIVHLEVDDNDNIYLAGRFYNCQDNEYPPRIDDDIILPQTQNVCQTLFLVKYSSEGDFIWIRQPQEPGIQSQVLSNTVSYDFVLDNQGVFHWLLNIPPGTYGDGALVNNQEGDNHIYVVKYNTDGDLLEGIPVDIQGNLSLGSLSFYVNPNNGHYYFTIRKYDDPNEVLAVGGEEVEHVFVLTSFDENGNYLWKRENTDETIWGPYIYNLAFDNENNIYMGGQFVGFGYDSFLGFAIEDQAAPSFVMKLNPTAESYEWATHHNRGSSSSGDLIYNPYTDEVAITDMGYSTNFDWDGYGISDPSGANAYIARFDPETGAIIGLDDIGGSVGYTEYGASLAVDSAGDYILGGSFAHNLYDKDDNVIWNTGGQTDYFLTKLATQACNELILETPTIQKEVIKIYPNPVKNKLHLTIEKDMIYQIYTVNGTQLMQGKLTKEYPILDLENLTTGLYFIQLINDDGNHQQFKVVKE